MKYDWTKDLSWIRKHLKSGKIISKRTKDGLLIEFAGGNVSTKPPVWFSTWVELEFRPFKQNVETRLDKIETRLDKIETRLDNLEKDVDTLKKDVAMIKSCPTIAKELQEMKNSNKTA